MNSLYINLLKKCLTNMIYGDKECGPSWLGTLTLKPMDESARMFGEDWPPTAHTMIGMKRLDNIEYCVSEILLTDVPGDFIECGVWRGGA